MESIYKELADRCEERLAEFKTRFTRGPPDPPVLSLLDSAPVPTPLANESIRVEHT